MDLQVTLNEKEIVKLLDLLCIHTETLDKCLASPTRDETLIKQWGDDMEVAVNLRDKLLHSYLYGK